jgi:hypothetical protein
MHHGYRIRMGKVWAHFYINGWTHILRIKSCVGHMHILVHVCIPLPYLFILACRSVQLSSARVDRSQRSCTPPTTVVIKPYTNYLLVFTN